MAYDFDRPLLDEAGEVDPVALEDYVAEVRVNFMESREGQPFHSDDAAEDLIYEVVERGLELGLHPTRLTAPDLEKVVFEGLPRGWHHPSEAAPILKQLAAILCFAFRKLRLPAAPACVAMLEAPGAQARLEAAFREANPSCPDPELAALLQEQRPGGRARGPRPATRVKKHKKKAAKKTAKKPPRGGR